MNEQYKTLTAFPSASRFSGNHIFQGLAAGIAVNENGRGQITGEEGDFDDGTNVCVPLLKEEVKKNS